MTQKQIQVLSALEGIAYVEQRNAFLRTAEPLPDYTAALADHDPRYRVQYLILQGWQQNGALYAKIDADLAKVNVEGLMQMASGVSSVIGDYRLKAANEWKRDVLPYAWEDIWKVHGPSDWFRFSNSLGMITAYPHADSVDPLLIAMHLKSEREAASYATTLRDMPKEALEERLEEEGRFYTFVEPLIRRALQGR